MNKKGFELGFLNGLINGRKKLKMNLARDQPRLEEDKSMFLNSETAMENGIVLVNEQNLKISTQIPKLFKIPFWLVSVPKSKKVGKFF